MWIEILLFVALLVYTFWNVLFGVRPKNYPPGPLRLPIVGSLPFLGTNPLNTLTKWKETYGNVIGLRFGDFNVVVLSGYETIKEAYDKPEFSGRPSLGPILLIAGKEKRGLVASEGPHWSEQRRFALRNLRDFGFGKKSMEIGIQEDVTDLISKLKRQNGSPITTERMLSLVVLSSLWSIVAGEKMSIDDPKATELLNTFNA
ncbi:Methyl farnesoate epoxidase [Folsomia candida]|uniref:Methyl farnesoate epoxidase n=2 Tax=Folsomia candida TaxID=158441 RepID=A0A226E0J3_FOLCA|nr:Methyl farnesoate epoxidase [Folsomia candida]